MCEVKNEGVCRFCMKTFSGDAMSRHLTTCKAKKISDEKENAKSKKKRKIYQLKVFSYQPFWLYLEVYSDITLENLDTFFRKIWLECCGHLSKFIINETDYLSYKDDEMCSFGWGNPSKNMDVKIEDVLIPKDKFKYEYDFGTTTPLEGQVIEEREGFIVKDIKILARNNPIKYDCCDCNKKATDYCQECDDFFCEKCLEKHECGDEMALPIVNSPRMGECGYTGDLDRDNFKIPEKN